MTESNPFQAIAMSVQGSPVRAAGGNAIAEPDLKRRRLLDAGGPIEDDETARRKMRRAKLGVPGRQSV